MRQLIWSLLASAALVACERPAVKIGALASDFTWTQAADCPMPRFEAMGLAVGGKLLVFGGFNSESLDVTSRV
ncbi:MAG TPA: hypothetical protein VKE49_03365, partial [Myxococcaceae bacterium]|nr:hypothetical protein [Myxococcaceae bacterium]